MPPLTLAFSCCGANWASALRNFSSSCAVWSPKKNEKKCVSVQPPETSGAATRHVETLLGASKKNVENLVRQHANKSKTDPLVSLSTHSLCLSTHSPCLSNHSLFLSTHSLSPFFSSSLFLFLSTHRGPISSPSKKNIVQACRECVLCIILPIYIQIECVLLDKMCSCAH